MSCKIPDKLLINLKIMANIQKNGRIKRSMDGIISLDSDYLFYQSIRRFLNNDSRKQSIFEINSVIAECHEKVKEIINNKFMTPMNSNREEFFNNVELLLLVHNSLKGSLEGINNLKFTYIDDHNTVSQLDIMILKIQNILKEAMFKINYFNSMLPNIQKLFIEKEDLNFNTDSIINMSSIDNV
jgi:hypothetical protein